MYTPKAEIYEALNDLGYYCRQGQQAVFTDQQLPAITFRIDNNSVNLYLSNDIESQNITAVVDLWANDSPTTSEMLTEVEGVMRGLGYRLSYSADVPAPAGALYHTNCRFDTLR